MLLTKVLQNQTHAPPQKSPFIIFFFLIISERDMFSFVYILWTSPFLLSLFIHKVKDTDFQMCYFCASPWTYFFLSLRGILVLGNGNPWYFAFAFHFQAVSSYAGLEVCSKWVPTPHPPASPSQVLGLPLTQLEAEYLDRVISNANELIGTESYSLPSKLLITYKFHGVSPRQHLSLKEQKMTELS